MPMGHEYIGIVDEVGSELTSIELGQFVGDGAVGLLAVLAAKHLGAERPWSSQHLYRGCDLPPGSHHVAMRAVCARTARTIVSQSARSTP
jgi:hypothetical protein